MERAKQAFVRFRGSTAFLYVLLGALVCGILCHILFGWDPDWSISNLLLSAEASLATCLLLDFSVRGVAADRATFSKLLEILEATKEEVDEIADELEMEDQSDAEC